MQRLLRACALRFMLFGTLAFFEIGSPAHAAVMQPDGQTIPLTGRLQALLNVSAANNNID